MACVLPSPSEKKKPCGQAPKKRQRVTIGRALKIYYKNFGKKGQDRRLRYWCQTALPEKLEMAGISQEAWAESFFTETGVGMILERFTNTNTKKACRQVLAGVFKMLVRKKYLGRGARFPDVAMPICDVSHQKRRAAARPRS